MSLILAILGFILFWGLMISKKKSQKGDSFDWEFWWNNNWFPLMLSFVACAVVFIASYAGGALTLDRSIMIGGLGSFLIERLQKMAA